MNTLQLHFDAHDATGRGSLFCLGHNKKQEIVLRARVTNATTTNAGLARVFLTRIERVDILDEKKLLTHDTLPLNWALTSGADVNFYGGYEHFVDLVAFNFGAKNFRPMTLKSPSYWAKELSRPGIYRLHLLLTGPAVSPVEAIFEMKWPMKKLNPENFSFSVTK